MAYDIKALASELYESVWSQGNASKLDELFEPDYTGYVPLVGTVDREGAKEALRFYRSAFPDLKIEIRELLVEGDKAAVRWTSTGTHQGELLGVPPTGKKLSVDGLTLFECRNGKIARDDSQFDVAVIFQALGVGAQPGIPMQPETARPELRH